MLRSSATVLLVCALLVGGCKKNNEETSASGAGGTPAAADKAAEPAAADKADEAAETAAIAWENVERVPFSDLQGLLPETAIELKRTDLAGRTEPGDYMHSEASAYYEGPDDKWLRLTVQDHPLRSRDHLSSKTSSFKGHPVVHESENNDGAELSFIVADRFFLTAQAGNLRVADLKAAFEKVDLTKLAAWKDHGTKQ